MTPKEKAKELIEKLKQETTYEYQEYAGAHYSTFEHDIETLKKCALITVDEIINVTAGLKGWIDGFQYWEEVKKEIETYGGNK
jgi:hypothetical protein